MFFMVAIHHMKTFRNGEYPPCAILNLVESHHMVNIHHYLLYDCSCNGLPASEGPDTRVYGSNSNLWKKRWMYTIFVILSFSRFISCSYSFWWSYLCFTEQQSCRWCHHSFWQVWPPWPSPWPPSTPPSSFYNSCYSSSGSYKTEGLYHYFRCTTCKKKQSLLHNTVLSNSNTLLHDFVLLMYQFWNSHRTYNTVIKETFLPQEGYKEKHLSRKTINKWFSYFRLLCMRAQKSSTTKVGGEGDVVELDESMSHRSGKC